MKFETLKFIVEEVNKWYADKWNIALVYFLAPFGNIYCFENKTCYVPDQLWTGSGHMHTENFIKYYLYIIKNNAEIMAKILGNHEEI